MTKFTHHITENLHSMAALYICMNTRASSVHTTESLFFLNKGKSWTKMFCVFGIVQMSEGEICLNSAVFGLHE